MASSEPLPSSQAPVQAPPETAGRAVRRPRLLVEVPRPASIRDHPRAPWLAVGAVCVGAFMGQLDASIVNLAYRPVERSFQVPLGTASWVGLSYLLTLVALVAPAGRLSDLLGRKLLYVYGFGIFVLGSALCGLSPSFGLLVGFRVLQAIGAAMMQANSVAIVTLAMPRDRLGRGIGIQGAAQALGLALGPTLGGLLVAAGGWRLLFLVNVPVGLAGIVLATRLVPRTRTLDTRGSFDTPGALVLPLTAGSCLGALSLGPQLGWASPPVVLLAAATIVSGAVFVRRERSAPAPLVDLALFRRGAVSAGLGAAFLSFLVMFGVMFALPYELVTAMHTSAPSAGLQLTLMPVTLGITAPLAGRLSDRHGPRMSTFVGMAVASGALALLAIGASAIGPRLVALALAGVGLGLFTPANSASVMGAVTETETGTMSGLLNLIRALGTAVGLAVAASSLQVLGFRGALVVLSLAAAAAAGISALRPPARTRSLQATG